MRADSSDERSAVVLLVELALEGVVYRLFVFEGGVIDSGLRR